MEPANEERAGFSRGRVIFVCAVLIALVFGIYAQTSRFGFVNYDDDQYVFHNSLISRGISAQGFEGAFTHIVAANWHPLTMIVHMVDCQLYGLWAGGHHLTNVFLHAGCAVLLFLLLLDMTAGFWPSAFVAALFAVHPLRVESVAWVSELKDVLSGVFFMLTLWTYVRYLRCKSRARYAMVLLCFMLGLLSKSMLVTVPFVLLLLDYWPLGRFQDRTKIFGLIREKIPLFVLTAIFCAVTILAQWNAIEPGSAIPLSQRVGTALVAYTVYLEKLLVPMHLANPYPLLKGGPEPVQIINACIVLIALTAAAIFFGRKQPWLLVGWFWYLGMLVPVIGLVHVGVQAYADRYTYLPEIGICMAVTWTVSSWASGHGARIIAVSGIAVAILGTLAAVSIRQVAYWHDSITLWTHTLACTRDNVIAYNNLGNALSNEGKNKEAIIQYQAALLVDPANAWSYYNLGNALRDEGNLQDAINAYRIALRIDPTYDDANYNLADVLLKQGNAKEAVSYFREYLKIDPDDADAHNSLALALFQSGRIEEAIAEYQTTLRLSPTYPGANGNLGMALARDGRLDGAIGAYRDALRRNPGDANTHLNLGNALLQQGHIDEAIGEYREASRLNPTSTDIRNNIAVALLRDGKTDEAIAEFRAALGTNPSDLSSLRNLGLALLENGKPADAGEEFNALLKLNPSDAVARCNLGLSLLQQGRSLEAIQQVQQALELQPTNAYIQDKLAWILATVPEASLRDGARALQLATEACKRRGGNDAGTLRTLAAAYAASGAYADAVKTARSSLELARGDKAASDAISREIKLYEAGQPYVKAP